MKKRIALLLAAAMLLSMTACGGSAEPAETAPATTEAPTTAPTEAPTEEPTEAPTEAPRVAPTDFEPVDPATLPKPIPVEEQLLSEDTQTITLGSLEEYEDLLWSLGFKEVRLITQNDNYCEPISLTYNEKAFRFNFTYCAIKADGAVTKETGWSMYGTKSTVLENISAITRENYNRFETTNVIDVDNNPALREFLEAQGDLSAVDWSMVDWSSVLSSAETQQESIDTNPDYNEEVMTFSARNNATFYVYLKAVHYPVTGNLYNYMRDPNEKEENTSSILVDPGYNYQDTGGVATIGLSARNMCFHYVPDAE